MLSYKKIAEELSRRDKILKTVIKENDEPIVPALEVDICRALFHSIISQQLSTKVADIIWGRFISLFDQAYPEAEAVLQKDIDELRSVGLSRQKCAYIQNVAEFALKNDLGIENLMNLTDKEIIEFLTQIKGVGKWTVQMILMFPMDRPNVFPIDDLGIQTKMKKLYSIDLEKAELKKKMLLISENWIPFQTLACKYLWQHKI